MSDAALRQAELAAATGDHEALATLTAERIRRRTGFVVVWYGDKPPLPGVIGVVAQQELEGYDPLSGRHARRAWALAVDDLKSFSMIASTPTGTCLRPMLLDLETQTLIHAFGRGGRSRSLLTVGGAGEPEEPLEGVDKTLFDTEYVTEYVSLGRVTFIHFFTNTRCFTDPRHGTKAFASDVNLMGNGGLLPPKVAHFDVTGVTVHAWGLPSDIETLRRGSTLRFFYDSTAREDWPMSEMLVGTEVHTWAERDALAPSLSLPPIEAMPLQVPLRIESDKSFDFVFSGTFAQPLAGPVRLTTMLHGVEYLKKTGRRPKAPEDVDS